uniref:Uncharacterized protein n=1 Tax=Physcomitrium patens TaxID=3218 RepID=A0A2K1J9D1_PHYPA|nr:hypothetical protein PHYPA_021249 [Physcomitrium patens]
MCQHIHQCFIQIRRGHTFIYSLLLLVYLFVNMYTCRGQLIWGVARKHGHSIVRGGPFIWPRLSLLLGAPLQMPPPASSIITIVIHTASTSTAVVMVVVVVSK